ncbi:sugar kinase [Aestuariivirga sp.]|uniref:sugar kinase n=1 Tax=Aestuariivirga sp. TaxID=2650926 RepID=UPI00301877B3
MARAASLGSAKVVVTLGEILIEIMATRRGQSFLGPGELIGPYPSGAPAIFIDQVARLGQPCGMISCVGDDDFGVLNRERLRADGVDVSAIATHPDAPTGSAFVTYQDNGDRHFVFNIQHSASGHIKLTDAALALLKRCDHLHIMGTSLISSPIMAATRRAIEEVKASGGTVSFDPNSRKELPRESELADFTKFILANCDLVLPSGGELLSLTGETTEEAAIASLLDGGTAAVVVKHGADGASYHDADGAIHAAPLAVDEVDPTGAGDVFDATFVVLWLRGIPPPESLRYANASGARNVLFKGPMEGVASLPDLEMWLAAWSLR